MEDKTLWKSIAKISKYMHRQIVKELKKYNIGNGQGEILYILKHSGDGKSEDEISKMISIDNTTATRTINRLVKSGYVKKVKDESDKRMNRIYLTKKVNDIYLAIKNTKKRVIKELIKDVDKNELSVFMSVIEKMENNVYGGEDENTKR